jgi:hypothetical protein
MYQCILTCTMCASHLDEVHTRGGVFVLICTELELGHLFVLIYGSQRWHVVEGSGGLAKYDCGCGFGSGSQISTYA